MDRIHIVGSSCSGKTTFAKALAQKLNVEHIELDALHWEPNWKEAELKTFRDRVSQAVERERWVLDGDYSRKLDDIVTKRATTTIWLDLPLTKILKRFFERSIRRSYTKELLWGGCRETLRNSIFSKDSLLIWILQNYAKKRRKLAKQTTIRLTSEKEIREFLARDL